VSFLRSPIGHRSTPSRAVLLSPAIETDLMSVGQRGVPTPEGLASHTDQRPPSWPKTRLIGSPALHDYGETLTHWRLWLKLGARDIKARYRRTMIGPFWTVLSGAILIFSLGLVYSILWNIELAKFLPYFSAGYISWVFITTNISENCSAFVSADAVIKSLRLPYTIHIMRVIWRNLVVFGHSLVVHVAVLIYFRYPVSREMLLLPVGLVLVMINMVWLGMGVAIVCTRFRDIVQVVGSVLQIAFFITPIFWPVENLAKHPLAKFIVADLNLAYHLVEVVRRPLIGEAPAMLSYLVLIGAGILGSILSVLLFSRFQRRIAYWL